MASRLDHWQLSWRQYMHAAPIPGRGSRFRHDSKRLLQAVRLAARIRGGSGGLVDVIAKSLAAALPPFLQPAFIDDVSGALHDSVKSSLPSSSAIQRAELALDVAMMLVQRGRAASQPDVVRVGWADSSPIGGRDWIWSEYHEIERGRLVETFEAVVSVANATSEYARVAVAEIAELGGEVLNRSEVGVVPCCPDTSILFPRCVTRSVVLVAVVIAVVVVVLLLLLGAIVIVVVVASDVLVQAVT
jgi:hypothetical protein